MTLLLKSALLIIGALIAHAALAQNGRPPAALPDDGEPQFVTQSFNPLLLSAGTRLSGERIALVDGRLGYASNTIDAALVNAVYNSEFIQKIMLDRNFSRRQNNTVVAGGGVSAGITFGTDTSLYVHAFFVRQRYDLFLKMSQGMTGVLFYGNAPYENETIVMSGSGKFLGFRQLQYVITTRASDNVVLTGSVSALQGLRVNEARYDGTLFTATHGEYLDLEYDFDFSTYSTGNRFAGTGSMGVGLGAGVMFHSNNRRHRLAAGLMETGWFFNGVDTRYYRADSAVTFEGFRLNNVFTLNDSSFVNFGDTIANTFGVKRGTSPNTVTLPQRYYLHYIYRLRNGLDLAAAVEWQPATERLVHTSLQAGRWMQRNFYAAAQINTSSFREINGGVTVRYNLAVTKKPRSPYLSSMFQTRFANAFLLPTSSRGFDLAAALSFHF